MNFFKLLKKIAAPAVTVAVALYVIKAPNGVQLLPFDKADLPNVYANAEKVAAEIIPDKIQSFISNLTEFLKTFR